MKHKAVFILPLVAILFAACEKDVEYQTIYRDRYIYDTPSKPITTIVRPPYLKKGDKIGVCSVANSVTASDLQQGIAKLQEWGLTVVEASNLYAEAYDGRYSGTLDQRIAALQAMIDNDSIRAIIMARGGYGTSQLLSLLDYSNLLSNPKWIIGYSDVTALHIALNNRGIISIHGPMVRGFTKDNTSMTMLHDALFGNNYTKVSIATNENCVKGIAHGHLVGGNLTLIYSECGTAFDLNTTDAILFIEETGEANYAIDRMLLALQMCGKLSQIKGVVIGEFTDCTQGRDLPLTEIIKKYFAPLGIPIMYGLPAGHGTQNHPLMLGSMATLEVDNNTASLTFDTITSPSVL